MAGFSALKSLDNIVSWLRIHPFSALGGALLLVLAIPFCHRRDSEWEEVYLPAATHLYKGEDIYRREEGYLYPPFMALTALPFLAFPAPLPRLLWFAANSVCLFAVLRWSWRLAGGGRLEGAVNTKTSERIAAILGCLCGISYLENCLAHQQTDIVIAAMLAGGCLLLSGGRSILAATAFGTAAACKCTALLWAPYLLWRGRPWAAVWLLAVALGLNGLPDLVSPAPKARTWLGEYASRFLKPMTASNHYIGTWGSDAVYNQSLTGLGYRWCMTQWRWEANDCTIWPRSPLLLPSVLRLWVYGLELSILAAVLWICGRPFRSLRAEEDSKSQALEYSLVLLLMVLLSPMSSKAHFGTLVLPGFSLARAVLIRRSPAPRLHRLSVAVLAASVGLGLLCNKDPLGERLYTLSLWYGVVTWQALLLLAGCLLLHRQEQNAVFTKLPSPAPREATAAQAA